MVNGRTYTSVPGVAVGVPDFDASGLQSNGWLPADACIVGGPYTVDSLPPATPMLHGAHTFVTDATSPTFLGALTGGGTIVCPVFCDGATWVSA